MKEYTKHALKSAMSFIYMLVIMLINIIFPHFISFFVSIPFIIVTIALSMSELVLFVITGLKDVTKKL